MSTGDVYALLNSLNGLRTLDHELMETFPTWSPITKPPSILVVSRFEDLGAQFAQGIQTAFSRCWPGIGLSCSFCSAHEQYPDITGLGQPHVWVVFSCDRVEPFSRGFSNWSDRHRDDFAILPPMLLNCYPRSQLQMAQTDPAEMSSVRTGAVMTTMYPVLGDIDHLFPDTDEGPPISPLIAALVLRSCMWQMPCAGTDWTSTVYWDDAVCRAITSNVDSALKEHPPAAPCSCKDESLKNALNCALSWSQALRRGQFARKLLSDSWDQSLSMNPINVSSTVESEARYVCAELNRRRLSLDDTQDQGHPCHLRGAAFCREYQELRKSVSAFADRFTKELRQMDENEIADEMKAGVDRALAGMAIVLVGPFSSGKTTFVNTLLGLSSDRALPIGGSPTTSSINIVGYAETPDDERAEVRFRREAEVHFIDGPADARAEGGRCRVRKEEINAFLCWFDDGLLPAANEIRVLRSYERDESSLGESDLKWLRQMRERDRGHIDYPRPDEHIPVSASIPGFADMYRPPSTNPLEVLGWLRDDKHALACAKVSIALFRPELAGLLIVDTPGTDSCISFHRTMAQEFIERNTSAAVICFFDAGHFGGIADKENMRVLSEWIERSATRHLNIDDRVFFVVTKRDHSGAMSASARARIMRTAQNMLRSHGWVDAHPFLVDANTAWANPDDHDWVQLVERLTRFAQEKQVSCLHSTMDCVCRFRIATALREATESYGRLTEEGKARYDTIAVLKQQLEMVRELHTDFEYQVRQARRHLFTRKGTTTTFDDAVYEARCQLNAIDGTFGRTLWRSHVDEKVAGIRMVVEGICRWKEHLRVSLTSPLESIRMFLQDELRGAFGAGLEVQEYVIPRDFVPFTTAKIVEETRKDVTGWLWVFYAGGMRSRIRQVRALLGQLHENGKASVESEFSKATAHFAKLLKHEEDRLKRDIQELNAADSPQVIENALRRVEFYQDWLREYDSLFGQEGEE